MSLDRWAWPTERLAEAAVELSARAGFTDATSRPAPAAVRPEPAAVERWVSDHVAGVGVEAEPVLASAEELVALLRVGGPALLRYGPEAEARWIAVLDATGRRARLIGPDGAVAAMPPEDVAAEILARSGERWVADVERLLETASVPEARRKRARQVLIRERSAKSPMRAGYLLRLPPGASPSRQARGAKLRGRLLRIAAIQLALYVLNLGAWALVGRGALAGHLDPGWLWAWGLLVLSLVPLQTAGTWMEGSLAIDAAALLRTRLFGGALRLDPGETRHLGLGQLVGRVIESEAIESLAMSGGLLAGFACMELALGAFVLAAGAGGWPHAALLVAWAGIGVGVGVAYYRARRGWTHARLEMTHALIEAMAGHRTRLAQDHPARWHDEEDALLSRYVERSADLDRVAVRLAAILPAGWVTMGLLALAPVLVRGGATSEALAVAIGGVLLGASSLRRLASGFANLAGAGIAWEQVRDMFDAAGEPEDPPLPSPVLPRPRVRGDGGPALVEARGVTFRYPGRVAAVLDGVDLSIHPGDRILMEGTSGGGKSTFGSMIAGLRAPGSGLLLLDGMDRRTLGGEAWRRRVVTAPQFHENHVIGGTFAFNLLMGRAWPPRPGDLEAAEALCRELGLGELLDRMPSGILQMVGETGWQLSHGEKSRLFIARALLQDADLVVLDESLAALDPDNLRRALACVLARARSVLVIAHP